MPQVTHGMEEVLHSHDEYQYEVVGILQKNGTVLDNLILTPLETVWIMHAGHDHDSEYTLGGEANHENPNHGETQEETHDHGHEHHSHDHHDQLEHDLNALVLFTDNPRPAGTVISVRDGTGGRSVNAHLFLHARGRDVIVFADGPIFIDQVLGRDKQA